MVEPARLKHRVIKTMESEFQQNQVSPFAPEQVRWRWGFIWEFHRCTCGDPYNVGLYLSASHPKLPGYEFATWSSASECEVWQ